jgi:PH (Pleckstrin Homology) domain-containing protein
MSRGILALTVILLLIPAAMLIGALALSAVLIGPLVFVSLIYAWVWFLFRPTTFVIKPGTLEVIWPLKRRQILRASIEAVRLIDVGELKREIGWGARVGAGGLWGGFGWLWTRRRGIVQMYISRMNDFVWIERGSERPWLITPERPEEFVRQLSPALESSAAQGAPRDIPASGSSALRQARGLG